MIDKHPFICYNTTYKGGEKMFIKPKQPENTIFVKETFWTRLALYIYNQGYRSKDIEKLEKDYLFTKSEAMKVACSLSFIDWRVKGNFFQDSEKVENVKECLNILYCSQDDVKYKKMIEQVLELVEDVEAVYNIEE